MENFLNKKYKFDRADEHFNDYLIGIGEWNHLRMWNKEKFLPQLYF